MTFSRLVTPLNRFNLLGSTYPPSRNYFFQTTGSRLFSSYSSIQLNRAAVIHNVASLRQILPLRTKLAAVLKGNAYGHGLVPMYQLVEPLVECIAVFNAEEALTVRKVEKKDAPQKRLLILGPVSLQDILHCAKANIEMVLDASWKNHLPKLQELTTPIRVHIHLDTGLTREGFDALRVEEELLFLSEFIKKHKVIQVVGVMSHLGDADDSAERLFAQKQIAIFNHGVTRLQTLLGVQSLERHIDASNGSLLHADAAYEMVRCGSTLYGQPSFKAMASLSITEHRKFQADLEVAAGGASNFYRPPARESDMEPILEVTRAFEPITFEPVLSWTCLSQTIKLTTEDRFVGYGCNVACSKDRTLAVFPVGIADGCTDSKALQIFIQDKKCPILAIMMNHIIVDVTELKLPKEKLQHTQLEATLRPQAPGNDRPPIYELSRIGAHLPRKIINGNVEAAEIKLQKALSPRKGPILPPKSTLFTQYTDPKMEAKCLEMQGKL